MSEENTKGDVNNKLTTIDMEIALANYFDFLNKLIVPNVSHGMFTHECDLIVLSKSGYLTEIEIKISKADLIKDKNKLHNHVDFKNKIKYLYFAIPTYLMAFAEHVPERAGIIEVSINTDYYGSPIAVCREKRTAISNSSYKLNETERYKIARLGAIRIWGLKKKIRDYELLKANP